MTGDNVISLGQVQRGNWLLLAAMAVAGGVFFSGDTALAIVVGGLIANLSFHWLKNDLLRLIGGGVQAAKARFFIKYYARLALLGLVLFLIINHRVVGIGGLLTGLSTVLTSIVFTVAGAARKIYFMKEAS